MEQADPTEAPTTRTLWFLFAVPVLGIATAEPPGRARPVPTCSTQDPHASLLRRAVQTHFQVVPESTLATAGLAARPDTVVIVTDDTTCARVIGAHNLHIVAVDSGLVIVDSAVVLRAGTSFLVERRGVPGMFVYDSVLSPRLRIEHTN